LFLVPVLRAIVTYYLHLNNNTWLELSIHSAFEELMPYNQKNCVQICYRF
jgi:hypothetical protein